MKEDENQVLKILNIWGKKKGIFLSISLFLSVYFFVIKPILKEEYSNLFGVNILNIYIPTIFIIIIFCIWLITSHRVTFFRLGELKIGLFLNLDDEKYEDNLKRISKNIIDEVREKHENLKITLYPINFKKSKASIRKYLNNNGHIIDSAICAKISSGNIKSDNGGFENHLVIEEITFIGKFNVNEKLKVFKTSIKLSEELNIRNLNKNWSYVESNSLNDKRKIHHNLKDTILFYSGIYFVYQGKLNRALNILKNLHSKEDSRAQISKVKKEIIGNKNFISASRLNDILLNLFILSAINSYENLDKEKAYSILKECEKLFPFHPLSFEHYLCLARFAFDLNKIQIAKDYTLKAKKINKNKTGIFLNDGFFGVIDENEEEICFNYSELSKVYKHKNSGHNFTEIIGWLSEKRIDYNKNLLFDFIIGTLNYFYSDEKLGKKTLLKIYNNTEFELKYPKVYKLCNKVIKEGDIKSTYHSFNKKKKNRKKRKKTKKTH